MHKPKYSTDPPPFRVNGTHFDVKIRVENVN